MFNRQRLLSQGSSLEFKLHRLQFIHLVSQGAERQADALVYARNFAPFAATHAKGKKLYNSIGGRGLKTCNLVIR